MQKRMKSAHPRTPGGRNFVPKGNQSTWGNSKFIPAKRPKAPIALKKATPEKDAA